MSGALVTASITTPGADAIWQAFAARANGAQAGPVDDMFRQWAARYLGFTRRRFVNASKGDGTWKPLAESTIKARRAGRVQGGAKGVKGFGKARTKAAQLRAVRKAAASRAIHSITADAVAERIMSGVAILRDTGVLLNGLTIGNHGNLLERIPNGVRVGFAANPHGVLRDSKATIQEIAGYHNVGGGKLSQRVILAEPTPQVVAAMVGDTRRALRLLVEMPTVAGGLS